MEKSNKELNRQIFDLLYIQKEVTNRIGNEINELLRGRGRTNAEIKESLIYMIEERLK